MPRFVPCAFCTGEATHVVAPDLVTGQWHPKPVTFDAQRHGAIHHGVCLRCATALADGETDETLARRLTTEAEAAFFAKATMAKLNKESHDDGAVGN